MGQDTADGVELVIKPRTKDLGGFRVRRALPDMRQKMLGPFIFFDHMGPAEFTPGNGIDVRAHPHIGIATITYLFSGQILHRDSLGYEQRITPGAVNWMTAGRGIVHSERTPADLRDSGSSVHGIQSWVALPRELEETRPAFDHYPADAIPSATVDGGSVRLIAGTAFGISSPVRTASETLYAEIDLRTGSTLDIPSVCQERAVYVVEGSTAIGGEERPAGTMVILPVGATPRVDALSDCKLMLFGGARLDGDRTLWWNFVSSSKSRIEQAKSDWRDRRFDDIDGESAFIPLPES